MNGREDTMRLHRTTHEGLGINMEEWRANMKHMADALDKNNVPQRERKEVLALVEGLRKDIVEK